MAVRHPLKRFMTTVLFGLVMLAVAACAAARAPEPAADEVFIEPELAAEAPAEGAAGEPAAPPAAELPDVQQGVQPGGQIIIKTGEMDLLVQTRTPPSTW